MKKKSDRERTPFGLRLLEARKAAGLSQKAVEAAIGIPQSTLAELESAASSSGYTAQLAALYGVDAVTLATGEPAPARGVAHDLSQSANTVGLPRLTWERLMGADLNQPFELVVMDDSLADEIASGSIARFHAAGAVAAIPGRPVLVRDKDGNHYLRDFQAGAGGRWKAVARKRGYQDLDSEEHGLVLVAVMKGVDWS